MRISLPLGAPRIVLGQDGRRAPGTPTVPDEEEPVRPGHFPAEQTPPGQDGGIPPGKAGLTVPEATDLLATLDMVVRPIEAEERALAENECLRELQAGPFPQIVRLRARTAAFLEQATPGDLFEISRGEIEVLEKAVACAESLGRGKTVQVAVAIGGSAAILALLLL
jgi:hypothetical protein